MPGDTKNRLDHSDIVTVQNVISECMARESTEFVTYTDYALAEICRQRGVITNDKMIGYYRNRAGFQGFSKRARRVCDAQTQTA